MRTALTAAAVSAALLLAACGGGGDRADDNFTAEPANVTFIGSPNATAIGRIDQDATRVRVALGGRAVVAAFRASGCGQDAPDFAEMMRAQAEDGLRVPDGITLYDAGIARYRSSRCKDLVPARAIGVFGNRIGTYELHFFGGKTLRTVTVG